MLYLMTWDIIAMELMTMMPATSHIYTNTEGRGEREGEKGGGSKLTCKPG